MASCTPAGGIFGPAANIEPCSAGFTPPKYPAAAPPRPPINAALAGSCPVAAPASPLKAAPVIPVAAVAPRPAPKAPPSIKTGASSGAAIPAAIIKPISNMLFPPPPAIISPYN